MSDDEEVGFITDDACLREAYMNNELHRLSVTDLAVIKEVTANGERKAQMMSLEEGFELMKKEKPEKADELEDVQKEARQRARGDELRDLIDKAGKTGKYFEEKASTITEFQALTIRKLRTEDRFSWRLIAAMMNGEGEPDDNQIYGMALCKRAAEMLGEHFMEGVWN